jgi:hypothetical protein
MEDFLIIITLIVTHGIAALLGFYYGEASRIPTYQDDADFDRPPQRK